VTQPPQGPDPGRPQDTTRPFPTYGRPEPSHAQQAGTPWAAPGQPPPPQQPQNPQYGSPQPPQYGQSPQYGHPAQPQYGHPAQYPPTGAWPTPYGYGYPGAVNRTNGLATAALATGIGGIFFGLAAPVAIGLGIAALVQLKKRRESGKGMAIAGLVIGSVTTIGYLVLFGVLIAAGASVDDDYGSPEPISSSSQPTTYVDGLAVGECFDDGDDEGEVVRRSCADPHDGEVISDVTLPDGPYPGDKVVNKTAKSTCAGEFAKYVGNTVDNSELDLAWWTPDEDLWDDEDRLVVCAAYSPPGEPLIGSVKGTKR
jgi:hypothetical protein